MAPASRGGGGRRSAKADRAGARRYPRSVRVNKVLRQVLAEALERLVAVDERLSLLTVTDVDSDPEFYTATVLFASLTEEQLAGLADARVRLQAEIGRQVRLKRTPLLSFAADPAVASGNRIEEILRDLDRSGGLGDRNGESSPTESGDSDSAGPMPS
jgi:ribosome-binding factor A